MTDLEMIDRERDMYGNQITPDPVIRQELMPPKRVRYVAPRTCAYCAYCGYGDGYWTCIRPNGPSDDIGDGTHYLTTCDRFRRPA